MMKGNMTGAPIPEDISTQLHDTAEKAASHPEMSFNSISHRTDADLLHEAYRQTRKDGASGADGVTAEEYAVNLGENLENLHERLKTMNIPRIVDADVSGYFENTDHGILRELISRRVSDKTSADGPPAAE
jgi:retron-type reverse transcriptase